MKKFIFILLLAVAVSFAACQGSRLIAPANESQGPVPVIPAPADDCPDGT